MTLASSNVGSLGGLVALRGGLCDIAGSHLLDLVHREQGIIVARGNSLGLGGIDDLARPGVRYVNRQRASGTPIPAMV